MEDSILAIVFAIGAAGRLGFGDAFQGDASPRLGVQAGQVLFDEEPIGAELYISRDLPGRRLQPVLGASLTDDGAAWAGIGLRWTFGSGRVWLESSLMPGLYFAGNGPDLGSPIEFRSALGLVAALDSGGTVALTVDHRSNAGLAGDNPGLETIGLRWSWLID